MVAQVILFYKNICKNEKIFKERNVALLDVNTFSLAQYYYLYYNY